MADPYTPLGAALYETNETRTLLCFFQSTAAAAATNTEGDGACFINVTNYKGLSGTMKNLLTLVKFH